MSCGQSLYRAPRTARLLDTRRNSQARPDPSSTRPHDGDGISPDANAVIKRHGLDRGKVLRWADHYKAKEGANFNTAPTRDFENAPLGENLTTIADESPSFVPFRDRFNEALDLLDYDASDGIISNCLMDGAIVNQNNESVYDLWKRYAESLEGLNVALYRTARNTSELRRFIITLGELDNYRHGRWRREGDSQDRVSTTVGMSNHILRKRATARVTYDADALRGWAQPVRYSPYPRNQTAKFERFGHEKDGTMAGEGEVHVHVGCPIPARPYIKIKLLRASRLRKRDAIEQYGDVGTFE